MSESILQQREKANKTNGFSKKKIIIIIIFLLAVTAFIFSSRKGIFGAADKDPTNMDTQGGNVSAVDLPSGDPDMIGMIESVNGNQMTILKFNPSNIPDYQAKSSSGSSTNKNSSGNAISLGTSSGNMMIAGGPPGGFSRSGSSGSSSGSSGSSGIGGTSDTREAVMTQLKTSSIGTETITVPIGIPIIQKESVGSSGQSQQKEGVFTDLTSDTVVKIWLDKNGNDKNTAKFVDIVNVVKMSNSNN